MLSSLQAKSRPQLLFLFALCSVLTHALGQIQPIQAAGTGSGGSASETTSSSQPLWTYQVKPNSYLNTPGQSQANHYGPVVTPPSLFDAFSGLSQRQGALTTSPFLSILPIILIAAGGLLLLLPMLTMMMASPFGGTGFGGYGGAGFGGYPQVGALSKKRSLADQYGGQRGAGAGLIEILENVSTTIEELSRKYSAPSSSSSAAAAASSMKQQSASAQKRAKSLLGELVDFSATPPANHKPTTAASASSSSTMMEDNSNSGSNGNSIGNGLASSAGS